MTANKRFKRGVRARARKTGESYTAALAQVRRPEQEHHMSEHPDDLRGRPWGELLQQAEAVLAAANEAIAGAWRLEGRFARGDLSGAWRVRAEGRTAVLKWHDPSSTVPYNPDAPAVVDHLRSTGYPTPAWLASGVTADGMAWSIQELVDADPFRPLDVPMAQEVVQLVDRHRRLRLPTTYQWNGYVRAHVFGRHPSHRRLAEAGPDVRRLLATALEVARTHRDAPMPDDEMVHCDLNVSNLLFRDGELVAVVDIEAAGRGCAAYDLLASAVNGVSWASDPDAVDLLVRHGLATYGPGPVAVVRGGLLVESTSWYLDADPDTIDGRARRHLDWLTGLAPFLN
jgi:hypothetical protein